MSSPRLFTPLTIRGVTLPNRVALSPLCMYSAVDGVAQPWHMAHLSTFARGKVGLVFTEATAVEARGRITPKCLGIWTDEQAEALRPIVAFIASMGSVPGIQLAHAGRKASSRPPFGERPGQPLTAVDVETDGFEAWETVAPCAVSAGGPWPEPTALDATGLEEVKAAFVAAAVRAARVGFQVIELHMAHGYLLHTFLSALSNKRDDEFGGPAFENRCRFPLEVTRAVRAAIPETMPLFVRVSSVDGPSDEGAWGVEDTVAFAKLLKEAGVDVVDCSAGGIVGAPRFRAADDGRPLTKESARGPGFQVPYAEAVKKQAGVASMAVGVIVDPDQAEAILTEERADIVALGRELMHDPFWTLRAAEKLGVENVYRGMWPAQYGWAVDRRSQIRRMNDTTTNSTAAQAA